MGTRPEAIKMAPVILELKKYPTFFNVLICATSQHREMLQQMVSLFDISIDIDLNLMQTNQTLSSLTEKAIREISIVLNEKKPDIVLVQGDTTTAMAGALASYYQKIAVGHIEAGLRTNDIHNPFPEEVNRRIISLVATYNYAPTQRAYNTLVREGMDKKRIFITGNTVIDALYKITQKFKDQILPFPIQESKKLILVTAHRRENFGKPLENICRALEEIVKENEDVEIVYPVHPNPNVTDMVHKKLSGIERINLIQPVEYQILATLIKKSYIILTDSGGIQEEAPAFGKPVLVLRKETERPEGVKAGVAKLVGTRRKSIIENTNKLLRNKKMYAKMAQSMSPYGDGQASGRIVNSLFDIFEFTAKKKTE